MSIVRSSKDKDQLLLDGFRYRRANKSQSIWRCCKNNCAGRVCFDGFQYVPVTDHNHSPAPEETISMQFKSNIAEDAARSHFPPRRIINRALFSISKDDGAAVPIYTSSQRTIERNEKSSSYHYQDHVRLMKY